MDIDNITKAYRGGDIKIKALEGGGKVIEGLLVHFTSPEQRDLYGEYFDASTDFHMGDFPIKGNPVLFNHGLDDTMGIKRIGTITDVKVTDVGLWVEAILNDHDEYMQAIERMIEDGTLGWSSGALPQSVRVDESTKHIKSWAIIEGSATHRPAMPLTTRIQTAKSLVTGTSNEPTKTDDESVSIEIEVPVTEQSEPHGEFEMNKERILELLNAITAELGLAEGEPVITEMMATMEEKAIDETISETEIVKSAIRAYEAHKAKTASIVKSALNDSAPVFKGASVSASAQPARMTVTDLKYANMTAEDLSAMYLAAKASMNVPPAFNQDVQSIMGESFANALRHKVAERVSKGFKDDKDNYYVRSVMPFRANEVDGTGNTGYGAEWVGQFYSTSLWEKARDSIIYQQLAAKGLWEQEIPQGAQTVNIPTEGSDPTVYASPESIDVNAVGYPEATAKISPFGTGTVALTAAEQTAYTSYTFRLDEDSSVAVAPTINRQLMQKMIETIDQTIINGDTTTSANTNINLIDGTPATGTSRPYYLALNGIRKQFLVTNTAYSRDAGATFTIADYLNTLALMPNAINTRLDNLLWIIDGSTRIASLGLPELSTNDVRGPMATINSGNIQNLYGIDLVTSGFLPLSNTAGKVSGTGSNNTKGTIALVYAPYWAFGWKRNITIETQRDAVSGANVVVARMRYGFVARGAGASAGSYNVAV